MLKLLICVLVSAVVMADLRMASQPKNAWKAQDRGAVKFVPEFALYMEPSDFNYDGLKKQRDGRGYDNFLRSNIDNEQDRRNFKTEDGKDHLPFRSYETAANDASNTVKHKMQTTGANKYITVTPGNKTIVPLRWNNPHSSELEVNIWIMKHSAKENGKNVGPLVVPIRHPACSGEGYQDNVFDFIVPTNFNTLGNKIPGFKGCKRPGDCILQIYAHSVESRTYSMGTPLIVTGDVTGSTTTLDAAEPCIDVGPGGAKYEALRKICLPSNDNAVHIDTAAVRKARLVSDVANHAYQNSDFSPYSGQQCDKISQNLQASAILKMVPGNRGELGKSLWNYEKKAAAQLAKKLDKKARNLIRVYESMTNQIIADIGKEMALGAQTVGPLDQKGVQKTNNCFRCAQVGSTTTRRLTTNTYIPSFDITNYTLAKRASKYIAPMYQNLIVCTDQTQGPCTLQIYSAVLKDMEEDFVKLGALGGHYLSAIIKDTTSTLAHDTNHKKIDAKGKVQGNSHYAARLGNVHVAKGSMNFTAGLTGKALRGTASGKLACDPNNQAATSLSKNLLDNEDESFISEPQPDMDGLMGDGTCDDDAVVAKRAKDLAAGLPVDPCEAAGAGQMVPGQMFQNLEDGPESAPSSAVSVTVSWLAVLSVIVTVAL